MKKTTRIAHLLGLKAAWGRAILTHHVRPYLQLGTPCHLVPINFRAIMRRRVCARAPRQGCAPSRSLALSTPRAYRPPLAAAGSERAPRAKPRR